jgi:hypothetical protein
VMDPEVGSGLDWMFADRSKSESDVLPYFPFFCGIFLVNKLIDTPGLVLFRRKCPCGPAMMIEK